MQIKSLSLFFAAVVFALPPIASAAYMTPGAIGNDGSNGFNGSITAYASSEADTTRRVKELAVNGVGLSASGHAEEQYNYDIGWTSGSGSPAAQWFKVDLGQPNAGQLYELDHLLFWNFNSEEHSDRGVKTADIYVSAVDDPGTNNDFATNTNWQLVNSPSEPITFTQAPGVADYNTPDRIDFEDVEARWVAFDIQSNWGYYNFTGISEVQFFEVVPEPSTWMSGLIGLAGLGLLRMRRKR